MEANAPALYDKAILMAVRACIAGKASEGQQTLAMDWIITAASNLYDMSYRKQDSHGTAFAEGRRFVGNQIVKMTRAETLKALETLEARAAKPVRGKRQEAKE